MTRLCFEVASFQWAEMQVHIAGLEIVFGHRTISGQCCIFSVNFIVVQTLCQGNSECCFSADEQLYNSGISLSGLLTICWQPQATGYMYDHV